VEVRVATTGNALDTGELEARVKEMYREVAEEPDKEFHFETGRALAERLGYPSRELDDVPSDAIDSFAGVGYYFDLDAIEEGETVIDLGSGSGMDSFLAARMVGVGGCVIGIDMTDAQLAKARRLASEGGFAQAEFREGYIERLPIDDVTADVVISNGVINLAPDKTKVFNEAAGHFGRAAVLRSQTSSPRLNSRTQSLATRRSGPRASGAQCSRMSIEPRSKALAYGSRR
jgi:SAM-dependent methyltransferase